MKWTMLLLALAASPGDAARVKKDKDEGYWPWSKKSAGPESSAPAPAPNQFAGTWYQESGTWYQVPVTRYYVTPASLMTANNTLDKTHGIIETKIELSATTWVNADMYVSALHFCGDMTDEWSPTETKEVVVLEVGGKYQEFEDWEKTNEGGTRDQWEAYNDHGDYLWEASEKIENDCDDGETQQVEIRLTDREHIMSRFSQEKARMGVLGNVKWAPGEKKPVTFSLALTRTLHKRGDRNNFDRYMVKSKLSLK